MMLLQGKVAVVTGGTRGIGRAVVEKYLENGAKVVLWGSRKETVEKAVGELRQNYGESEVSGMYPNLTDAAEVEAAIAEVKAQYGRIDILVNNAGISQSTPLYQYTAEDFDKIMKLNVSAMFYTILPTAKIMKEQGGGVILNTSSMVSISGQPSGVGYPTSKFAVNGLTISLSRELAKDHIRVNAVAPGRDENGYGKRPASAHGRCHLCQNSYGKTWRAQGSGGCVCISGKRYGILCDRGDPFCGRSLQSVI